MTHYLIVQIVFWGALLGLSISLLRGTVGDKTGAAVYAAVCFVQFGLALAIFLARGSA